MALDAAAGFLEGLAKGMEPGLKAASRKNERLERAAETRALAISEIEHSANVIADRLSPTQSEDGSETEAHSAARKGLIKYAGHRPERLRLIEEDQRKGGKYYFGDTPRSGGTHMFGKLTRYSGLSAGEERESREIGRAVDAHFTIQNFMDNNNNEAPENFLDLLIGNELEKAGVQGEPDNKQRKKARDSGLYKLHAYYTHFTKQHKFKEERGLIQKDVGGTTRKTVTTPQDLYNYISGRSSGDRVEQESGKRYTGRYNVEDNTLFTLPSFLGGSETPSISLGDFSGSQQKEINDLISGVRQAENKRGGKFSRENLRIIARGFVDDPDTTLSSERQEDVLKLLEALLQ